LTRTLICGASTCFSISRSAMPGIRGQLAAQRVGLPAQRVEVVAENLDGDLRTHAGEHVVDAVRDRLADGNGRRQVDQAGADVRRDLAHRAGHFRCRLQADIQFADMDAFGMLVEFRPAAASPDVHHLGHRLDQHLGLLRQSPRTRPASRPD
jgi:hypothetical protein